MDWDSKLKDEREGVKPLNCPRGYRRLERRHEKRIKKRTWGTKGGFTAPVIVPATPGGELARRLREVAEAEAIPGLKFKISERGGMTIERQLQKSNPTGSSECGRPTCGPCSQPGGNGGSKLCQKNILFMSTNVNILIVMQHTGGKAPKIFIQEICNISITTGEVKKVQQKLKKNPSCINTNKINMMEVQLCLNNQFLDHIRIV